MWLRALDSWVLSPWWQAHKLPVRNGQLVVDGNSLVKQFVPRRGMPLYLLGFVLAFFAAAYVLVLASLPKDRVPVFTPAALLAIREAARSAVPALAAGEEGNWLRSVLFQLAFINLGFAFTSYVTTNRRSPFRGMHGGHRDLITINAAAVLFLVPLTTLPMAQDLFLGGPASAVQVPAAPLLLVPHVPPALASGHGVPPHAHHHGHEPLAHHSAVTAAHSLAGSGSNVPASSAASDAATGVCTVGVDGQVSGSCTAQLPNAAAGAVDLRAAETEAEADLLFVVDGNGESADAPSELGDLDSAAMDAWLAEEAGVDIGAEGVAAFLQHHRLDARTHDGRQGARLAAAARAAARRAWQLQHRADVVPSLAGELHGLTLAAMRAASCIAFRGSGASNASADVSDNGNASSCEGGGRAIAQAASRAWTALSVHAARAWSVASLDGAMAAAALYFAGALIGFHVAYAVRAGLFTGSLSGHDVARASRWQAFGMVGRVFIIAFFLAYHVAWAADEGVLGQRAAIYCAAVGVFAWLTRLLSGRYYLHLHHWFVGLALSPLGRTRSVGLALMLQGVVAAQAIDGTARFSCAPLFHRHRDCADWEGYH